MNPFVPFAIGLLILLIATNQLIKLTTKLAHSLRLSPLIVGITVVAIGTSLPELVVSLIAASKNDFGLAIGNILGSNIINILLVLSVGIIFSKVRVGTTKTQKNSAILAIVSFIYLASFWIHIPGIFMTCIFIGMAILFTLTQYIWGVAGRNLEDKVLLKSLKVKKVTSLEYGVLGLCLILIFVGGSMLVQAVEKIAQLSGQSTTILGLSITAIATSLPEIIATLMSIQQKETKLLVGNIIGSNVYNILLIGGLANVWIQNYTLPAYEALFFLLTVIIFLATIIIYRGKIIPRYIGIAFLIICIFYFKGMYK